MEEASRSGPGWSKPILVTQLNSNKRCAAVLRALAIAACGCNVLLRDLTAALCGYIGDIHRRRRSRQLPSAFFTDWDDRLLRGKSISVLESQCPNAVAFPNVKEHSREYYYYHKGYKREATLSRRHQRNEHRSSVDQSNYSDKRHHIFNYLHEPVTAA